MPATTASLLAPWQPTPDEPWNLRRVVHLHRRAGFGGTWDEIQRDLADGHERAIERILQPTPRSDDNEFASLSAIIADAAAGSGDVDRLKAWWLYRLLLGGDALGEKLTLMWHNHFATSYAKVGDVELMRRQNDLFREFARRPFGELLRRTLTDPALLIWLDAASNRKEHPNENLARESMELFALGVGNYSEDDVREAARALTGWSVHNGSSRFRDADHDTGEKTIFGQRGNWTGDDFVKMLFEHPATARRVAFRLCDAFMGETTATTALIEELAGGLREHDLDIGWGVETLLRSEAFFAEENIGNRVLPPIDYVIGALRSLEMNSPPPGTLLLAEVAANLGQNLFEPPNVFGWPGGRSWLTTRTVIGRANFVASLLHGDLHIPTSPFDAAAFAAGKSFTSPEGWAALYGRLLLGREKLPEEFAHHMENPDRLVAALLVSPHAQLA
ncbi:MAG: DUF1800 domain-containing protein [Planctomycetaceae bacterium]